MSDPERPWRQAPSPDLATRISDRVRHAKQGKHVGPRRSRHRHRPARHRHRLHAAIRIGILLIVTAACVALLRVYVIASFYIPSESMEPTLHGCSTCQPDRVLVDKLTYRFSSVSRSDVIVFNRPPNLPIPDEDLIKRVIGLPGETVSAHGGSVYIGDRRLDEPYMNPDCGGTRDFGPVVVPAGRYFVMGDNRCNSSDSRVFGPIPRSSIVGRAFAIVWPLKRVRLL